MTEYSLWDRLPIEIQDKIYRHAHEFMFHKTKNAIRVLKYKQVTATWRGPEDTLWLNFKKQCDIYNIMPQNITKIVLEKLKGLGYVRPDGVFVIRETVSKIGLQNLFESYLAVRGTRPVIPFGPRGVMSKAQAEWEEKNWRSDRL